MHRNFKMADNASYRFFGISFIAFCFAFLFQKQAFAQSVPQKFSYQAVIRDDANQLLNSQSVGIRLSILQGSGTGNAVYVETHTASTSAYGLVSLQVGGGTIVSGSLAQIDWANGPYFIKTETDPLGGNNYSITGSSQMLSVPYALFSANGTPGPQGPAGATGPQGPQGPAGQTGATGPQGPIGLTGPAGQTGAIGPQGPAGQTGATGTQGIAGTNGKTILNGTTKPGNSLGTIGDFYINTASDTLYGPKSSGGWGSGISLVGPKGSFPNGVNPGDMQYWDGSQWMMIPMGEENQILTIRSGKPMWLNNSGGSYGEVADIDGNKYKTVKIGNQIWMAEDLGVTKFRNGDPIPSNITNWNTTNQPAYGKGFYINNFFGGYYNYYAITDARNLCPIGWKVPSVIDFQTLQNFVGENAGLKLRSKGFMHWLEIVPNTNGETYGKRPTGGGGTDFYGFSATGNGYYAEGVDYGSLGRGTRVYYATSEIDLNGNIQTFSPVEYNALNLIFAMNRNFGISVRCLKE